MKKRSILLTCIVAVMALAMFVGCDSAPVFPDMPQSVKSGYIIQDGDILSGQAFNASKFSVYVVYDNGKSEKIATAAVTLDDATASNNKVYNGSAVSALVGYNSDNNPVYAEGMATTYDINYITVAPRTEVDGYAITFDSNGSAMAVDMDESDLVVTAYYGEGKSVVLNASEYDIVDYGLNGVKFSGEAVNYDAVATIRATVGVPYSAAQITCDYAYKAVFAPTADTITSIVSITVPTAGKIPALAYEEVPAPSFKDVELTANFANGTQGVVKTNPGESIRLFYVDPVTNEEITDSDFRAYTDKGLLVGVEFNDADTIQTKTEGNTISVVEARTKVSLAYGEKLDYTPYVVGTEIADIEIDPSIFKVQLAYGDTTENISVEDVELRHVKSDLSAINATDTVTASQNLYIVADYLGVTTRYSANAVLVDTNEFEEAKVIKYNNITNSLKPASTFNWPVAQYYDDISGVIEGLTSDAIAPFKVSLDGEDVDVNLDNLEVVYTTTISTVTATTPADVTALDDEANYNEKFGYTALAGDNPVYIYVEYSLVDKNGDTQVYWGFLNVRGQFEDAEPSKILVDVDYTNVNSADQPMVNSPVEVAVYTANETGKIEKLDDSYGIINDGKEVSSLTVGEAIQNVTFYYRDNTNFYETPVSIPAGQSYIKIGTLAVEFAEDYIPLYGKQISCDPEDYVITGWEVVGADESLAPEIRVLEAAGQDLLVTGNEVTLSVTYIDGNGKEVPTTVTKTFNSVANVSVTGTLSIADIAGRIENGKVLNGQSYNITECVVDKEDYIPYGNITLEVESVEFDGKTTSTGSVTFVTTETGPLTVNIKPFLNSDGVKVEDASITLNVVSSLE